MIILSEKEITKGTYRKPALVKFRYPKTEKAVCLHICLKHRRDEL